MRASDTSRNSSSWRSDLSALGTSSNGSPPPRKPSIHDNHGHPKKVMVRRFSTHVGSSYSSTVDLLSSNHSTASGASENSPPTTKSKASHDSLTAANPPVVVRRQLSRSSVDSGGLDRSNALQSRRRRQVMLEDEQALHDKVKQAQKRLAGYAELSKQLSQVYMECAEENDVTTAAEVAEAIERLERNQHAVVDLLLEARYWLGDEDDSGARYCIEKPLTCSKSLLSSVLRHSSSAAPTANVRSRSTDAVRTRSLFGRLKPTTLLSNLWSSLPTFWGSRVH
eukprot:GHVS01079207.1.p1 GENE.GHVS01079207.1~~GHVS01079207.1.p1  ORF type:complete len:281 (+),score=34.99 GHVS01079207.1:120-962(+)